jgi:2-keto-4-pentenoate hydratase/acetyl esterase/lipase
MFQKLLPLLLLTFSLHSASQPDAILDLWPEGKMPGPAPMVEGVERDLFKKGDKLIAGEKIIKLGHVANPQLHVYLPNAEKANGAAVVICPGGGFSILAWDLEGTEVAEWLNELGVAAIVLKYRVPTRQLGNDVEASPGSVDIQLPRKSLGPVMDAQRALSLVRAHNKSWNIDSSRVGILGFSAGGETAALAATALGKRTYSKLDAVDDKECDANFALLIYPGGLADRETGELRAYIPVSESTPPMFFAHAADDRVTPLASTALFEKLEMAGVDAELHIFSKGGHGYGLRPTHLPITRWPRFAEEWMQWMNLLDQTPLTDYARYQLSLKLAGLPLPLFHSSFPKTGLDPAYKVQQDYVFGLANRDAIAGFKGAVVGEAGQKKFGIDGPLSGVLFQSGWHNAKDRPVIPIREGANPGIETELGIILSESITESISCVEDLKSKVSAIVPVIELPAGIHDWSVPPRATDLVAVNVDSDNYIVGKEYSDLSLDLDALPIQLHRNGKLINDTTGGNAYNGQWANFQHQVNWALEQGYELKPGTLIITGALGQIRKEGVGEYVASYGMLGKIEFSLVEEK